MAKPLHEPGVVVDDYRLEELAHSGGMATLWRVSRPGVPMPLPMKGQGIGESADPRAIVSFGMEQMILPRLTGVHVPKFVAAGDFAVQPYIVMEAIPGQTLLPRLPELPLPDTEVAKIGVKIAMALDDLHRQHVVHLHIKPSNIMFPPTGEGVLLDYGLLPLAAEHRAALPRDRAGLALSDGGAPGFRSEPPDPGQADQAVGAIEARSADHRIASAVQSGRDAAAHQTSAGRPAFVRADRCRRYRSHRGVRGAQ